MSEPKQHESNGDKSKIIFFLLGILQALLCGWIWRVDASVTQAQVSIATLNANYLNIQLTLSEIKDLLKKK